MMNRPLLLVTGFVAAALFAGGSLLLLLYAFWPVLETRGADTSADEAVLGAAQFGVLGALSLGLGLALLWQVHRASASLPAAPFRVSGPVVVGAALAFPLAIGGGLLVLDGPHTAQGYLFPIVHLLVVLLPVVVALGLAERAGRTRPVAAPAVQPGGLSGRNSQSDRYGEPLSRAVIGPPAWRRVLGALTWGLTGGAGLAILLQLVAIVLGLVLLLLLPALTGQGDVLRELGLDGGGTPTLSDSAIGDLLGNPLVVLGLVVAVGVVVPLIEEPAKGLAVVLLRRRLSGPRDGFLYGAAAGAGFGLLENIFYSTTSLTDWAVTASLRFGTVLMHSLSSGLVGLGIYYLLRRRDRRGWRAIGAAVALHGLWNGSQVVIIAMSTLHAGTTEPLELARAGDLLGWAWLVWTVLLGIGSALLLIVVPRRLARGGGSLPRPPAGTPPYPVVVSTSVRAADR